MTISVTRGSEMTVNQIIRRALHIAGVMHASHGESAPTWKDDAALARALLDTIIDELQTDGNNARAIVFYNLALTSGTYIYDLESSALDVVGDGMYIFASETDLTKATGEVLVQQISREEWQRTSNKSATGRPMRYWVNREPSPIQVYLWPIPDEAGHIRLQIYQWYSDALDGSATVELQPYWVQYLIWELGGQIAHAKQMPQPRVNFMQRKAMDLRDRARGYSAQHVGVQMIINHPTAWGR